MCSVAAQLSICFKSFGHKNGFKLKKIQDPRTFQLFKNKDARINIQC